MGFRIVALVVAISSLAGCQAVATVTHPTMTPLPLITVTTVAQSMAGSTLLPPTFIPTVSDSAEISGTLVVVVSQVKPVITQTSSAEVSNLALIELPQRTMKLLTQGDFIDQEPRWSPDGQAIAFSSNRSGRFEIFTLTGAGNNMRQITSGEGHKASPTWSPDGKRLAFVATKGDASPFRHPEIDVLDLQTGEIAPLLQILEDNQQDSFTDVIWSPVDVRLMLYTKNEAIYPVTEGVDVSTRYLAQRVYLFDALTRTSISLTPEGWTCSTPRWSPDGSFVSMSGCFPVSSEGGSMTLVGALVQDAGTYTLGHVRALNLTLADCLCWSPDGIAWIGIGFMRNGSTQVQIYRVKDYLEAQTHVYLSSDIPIAAISDNPILKFGEEGRQYRQPDWR